MTQAIMIQGTASNVGKSIVTTALCRILARDGYKTAPFKSWNMALNSYVTAEGGEIGRAQAIQAAAAGIDVTVNMQPLLLKPKGNNKSQVIVQGKPIGDFGVDRKTNEYIKWALRIIEDSLSQLAQDYDRLVLEGAGSPAEINIKDRDIANMKVAKLNQTPVLLVADIDRGGALASVVGTLKLLEPEEKKLVKGIILNKFRGDYDLLKPGIEILEERTGKPVVGVIPYFKGFKIPDEDSVSLQDLNNEDAQVKIGIIDLPHISNFTDFDALALEPEVSIEYINKNKNLIDYDALIIPGTKNTTEDLRYLKKTGLAQQIINQAQQEKQIVGICGGYQILGSKLLDPNLTEGDQRELTGLNLLDLETTFDHHKLTHQAEAEIRSTKGFLSPLTNSRVKGYEIHMGETKLGSKVEPMCQVLSRSGQKVRINDGAINQTGLIWGTYLHGIFDNDKLRREFINSIRRSKGLTPVTSDYVSNHERLEESYNQLAQVIKDNLDLELIYEILGEGEI